MNSNQYNSRTLKLSLTAPIKSIHSCILMLKSKSSEYRKMRFNGGRLRKNSSKFTADGKMRNTKTYRLMRWIWNRTIPWWEYYPVDSNSKVRSARRIATQVNFPVLNPRFIGNWVTCTKSMSQHFPAPMWTDEYGCRILLAWLRLRVFAITVRPHRARGYSPSTQVSRGVLCF